MVKRFITMLVALWIAFGPTLPASALGPKDLERQLGSKQGIAELMPAFRDGRGQFRVPDPTKDPQAFLKAQQTLTILIDQAESQALNPSAHGAAAPTAVPTDCHPHGDVRKLRCELMVRRRIVRIQASTALPMARRPSSTGWSRLMG